MGSLGGGSSKSTSSSTNTSTNTVPRPPASAQENTLRQVAQEQYNDYMTRFAPLNSRLLELTRAQEGRDIRPAMGRANADVRLAMSGGALKATQEGMKGLGRSGTGRGLMGGSDQALNLGKTTGDAVGGAYRAAHDQEFAGLLKMAAQGRDIQDASLLSTAEAGDRATREALARSGSNRSSTGSGSFSGPASGGSNPWASSLTSAAGAAARIGAEYLFAPSTGSPSTIGGPGTYYDTGSGMTTDLGFASSGGSSGGGFFDSVGSFFTPSVGGGSYYGSGFVH